jgi:hypothetical protein
MQGRMVVPRLLDSLNLTERPAHRKPHRHALAAVLFFLNYFPAETMIGLSANMMLVI